jgi:hypothetical protein
MNLIVLDVLTQDQPRCRSTVISIRSRHSRRALEIHRSAIAFARGAVEKSPRLQDSRIPGIDTFSGVADRLK